MDKAIQFLKNGYSSKEKEIKPEDLLPTEGTKDLPASKSILTIIAEGYKQKEQK